MSCPCESDAPPPPTGSPPSPLPPDLDSLPAAQLFWPLLTRSLHVFTVCDAGGRYVYVSDSISNLLGWTPARMLGCARARGAPGAAVALGASLLFVFAMRTSVRGLPPACARADAR
jgi:hypothetical protein